MTEPWNYQHSTTFDGGCQSVTEALQEAGLDWNVTKVPVYAGIEREVGRPGENRYGLTFDRMPQHHAVLRESDGKPLGIVGKNYSPIQNKEAFSIIDPVLQQGGAKIKAVGSMRGGRVVWMYLDVGDSREIVKGDEIAPRMMLLKTHDSTSSFKAIPMASRMLCTNIVPSMIRDGKSASVKIRHSGDVSAKLDIATRAVDYTYRGFEAYMKYMQRLTQIPVSAFEIQQYIEVLFPATTNKDGHSIVSRALHEKRENFKSIWNRVGTLDDRNHIDPELVGTAYAAYQSATYYGNHTQPVSSTAKHPNEVRWRRVTTSPDTHRLFENAYDYFM